jgi:prephenate dehydrogenase
MASAFEPFGRVAIIGVGMMGGSLGLALGARGLAHEVVGIDLRPETLKRACEMQAISWGTVDLAEGVRGADCVVVAAPVGLIASLLEQIAPYVRPDALITDLGSVKGPIVTAGQRLYGVRFVGGHPMAGSERSGVEAAMPSLFVGAAWAIIRSEQTTSATVAPALPVAVGELMDGAAGRIAALAEVLGAHVIYLDAAQHDRIAALVSHLPHLLSFSYAQAVEGDPEAELARSMAGGSYRDLMRVSRADGDLWRDIFHQNRDHLRTAIAAYESALADLKRRHDLL